MTTSDIHTSAPVAKSLNVILFIFIIILTIFCIAALILAGGVYFDNPLRETIFNGITEGGGNITHPRMFAASFLFGAVIAGAYLYVTRILRAIVGTLLCGDPFVPDNISRLRRIWIVLAATEIFRMIVHSPVSGSIQAGVEPEAAFIDIRLGAWFLVFVVAALAEVFRHGTELRRDQELTV